MIFAHCRLLTPLRSRTRPFSTSLRKSQWLNELKRLGGWGTLAPRDFPTSGFELIEPSIKIDEEQTFQYNPEKWFPVHLGQVFQHRYQVVSKLTHSDEFTMWLARDLRDHTYVALKIIQTDVDYLGEFAVYDHIIQQETDIGQHHIRPVKEFFMIEGPRDDHSVIVQPPVAFSMVSLQSTMPGQVLKPAVVKGAVEQALRTLDFLHNKAHVIHGNVHPSTLFVGSQDKDRRDEYFSKLEERELRSPSPRKVLKDRTIHRSRFIPGPVGELYLDDFRMARINISGNQRPINIVSREYACPEMLLGMKWSYPVDMWCVGLMAWEMLHANQVYTVDVDIAQRKRSAQHLATTIALLGPPPLDFLKRSKGYSEFWDQRGRWKELAPIPQGRTFEALTRSLEGGERARFLDFIRALVCWKPEERLTVRQALSHPWLTNNYA
ncbi:kinase-like protein [Xylaria arbuscula]|nr:kinase-like protein [Xylaria arbuscula]